MKLSQRVNLLYEKVSDFGIKIFQGHVSAFELKIRPR